MRYICDFHIHSHYSRATSKDMNIEELDKWARIKGIDVLGTGDFTHPKWFRELQEKLEPAEEGLYKFKNGNSPIRFILTVEVSSIYSQGGQVRRIHNIVFAPSFEAASKLNRLLGEVGNLRADGRPILGLPAHELLRMTLDVSEDCLLVPAHAWTPWFSIFGSKSGFNSIEECFGDLSKYIYAIETGLSSDPAMNWRLSALDNITLISNSDCHSARRIGREANVFEGDKLNYKNIIGAVKKEGNNLSLVETIEFYPEEGKYHYDGHRDCKISLSPKESQKINETCPKCGSPLTVGVLSRVEELADRPDGYKPARAVSFRRLVPLDEIIAEALGVVGSQTKGVLKWYNNLIESFGNEFNILLAAPLGEVGSISLPEIAEGLRRVREGELYIAPGYDGEYGKVRIFKENEKQSRKEQPRLFNM
ncbi:MAG: endonuclease Q family protein [Candidatus Spechtbacterales bacterium]